MNVYTSLYTYIGNEMLTTAQVLLAGGFGNPDVRLEHAFPATGPLASSMGSSLALLSCRAATHLPEGVMLRGLLDCTLSKVWIRPRDYVKHDFAS